MSELEAAQRIVDEAKTRWGVTQVFGVMEVESLQRVSTVLIGSASHTSTAQQTPLAVIDWRTAPLAEVYFGVSVGDAWEGPGGLVRLRSKLGLEVDRAGTVHRVIRPESGDFAIPPRAHRTPFRSPLDVTLDAVQQAVVDLVATRHALVLGEAGFGKTTVALRRLERLALQGGPEFRGAVIVPTEGLRRLASHVLERRGLTNIDVLTFEGWARHEAHKAFRVPQRESSTASSRTITLKRHVALARTLPDFVARRSKGPTTRRDLLHLFGDTAWLDRVVAASQQTPSPLHVASVAEVAEHTRVQFEQTTEQQFSHVTDATRMQAVDGARLDAGTPDEDANSIDAEDYAVLFALEAERARRQGHRPRSLARWHALVVDEAQEFAPLELELLARGLKPKGCVIVAGDAAQQVDSTTTFTGWSDVMQRLSASDFERTVLEVNYRCPADVTAYARAILKGETAPRESEHITLLSRANEPQIVCELIDALRVTLANDPSASVAVICRTADSARSMARTLSHGVSLQLSLDGDFSFRPGLLVTSVLEVKGLEFDVVVVHDADGQMWAATAEARRALYVAVTRATHQLVLTSRR